MVVDERTKLTKPLQDVIDDPDQQIELERKNLNKNWGVIMQKNRALVFFDELKNTSALIFNEDEFCSSIHDLCDYFWKNGQDVSVRVSADNIWYVFERNIWEFGERLRIYLKENKKIAKNQKIHDCIIDVAKNKKYGKGRQTFILLIGVLKIQEGKEILIDSLDDNKIKIQAIDSIIKLRIKGLNEKIEDIYTNSKSGLKKEAKKYLDRYMQW